MPNTVTKDLSNIPFGSMIGGPLSACIDAQEQAAASTVDFIERVGFDKENPGKVVNIEFRYNRDGKEVVLSVPLLTIVPIPFISIDTVNIDFKATLKSLDTETYEETEQERKLNVNSATGNRKGLKGLGIKSTRTTMYGSVSTKKDSSSTKNSAYSVEANIDINIIAHQESMPAGLSKVLEILQQSISIQEQA